jgi:hypothetical protein
MSGQPNVPGWFIFDVTSIDVQEPAGPGVFQPSTIIPRTGPFQLIANFSISELFGRGMNDLVVSGNPVFEYDVRYFAQMIGGSSSYKLPVSGPHTISCISGTYSYGSAQTTILVPANTLDVGTYTLTCTVKMAPLGMGGVGFPWHVTGFVVGPMIEIY